MDSYYSGETSVWTRDSDKSTAVCPFAKKYCTHLCALAVDNLEYSEEQVWHCGLLGNNPHEVVKYIG